METDGRHGLDQLGHYLSFKDACRFFPRPNGGRVSLKTMFRWAGTGVRGVKLKTIRFGGQVCTAESWIREFIRGMNVGRVDVESDVTPSTRESDRRARVDSELDEAGF